MDSGHDEMMTDSLSYLILVVTPLEAQICHDRQFKVHIRYSSSKYLSIEL